MEHPIVRLSALTLKNIKNVKNGTVCMPSVNNAPPSFKADILGIYGQNGSGKTAIVDALYFLQQIMIGSDLDSELVDYMDSETDHAEITAEFLISREESFYEIGYHVQFMKMDSKVCIDREFLNCAITQNGIRSNKNIFMDYQRSKPDCIFKPQKRLNELVAQDKNLLMDLIVARRIAEKSNCSYIFGESNRDIFCRSYDSPFEN